MKKLLKAKVLVKTPSELIDPHNVLKSRPVVDLIKILGQWLDQRIIGRTA